MLENISEYIYPTEYAHRNRAEPVPQAPKTDNTDGAKTAAAPAKPAPPESPAPALPDAFETRNTGFTLEIEPTIGGNDKIIDLRFAPDIVTMVERVKWGQGASEAEMPVFESQRLTTALSTRSGVPIFVGTPSRPPVSKQDADSGKRIWFAFVTPTIVKVPR